MSRVRRIIATAGILATAGAGSFVAATTASATTSACKSNPYCYTQEVHGTTLVMSVGSNRGPFSGEQVVVQNQDDHSTASDFLAGLAPFSVHPGDNAKLFEYAPRGRLSGYCVSEPRSHAALVLRPCDGSANQAWVATQVGTPFEWINQATNDAMTDPGRGGNVGRPGTQITGAPTTGGASQLWDAVDS
jgi:hypothetical protein